MFYSCYNDLIQRLWGAKMAVVIDLFAGAGGLSLGAARAGFSVGAAVEIDRHAIETHAANFPNTIHSDKVSFIEDPGLPLFPCRSEFKFPVMKSAIDISHHSAEVPKFLGISHTDVFLTLFLFSQADPLVLFMPGLFPLGINVQMKIIYQLECGLLCIQRKHLLNEVDHIAVSPTSETVKPLIDLHARMLVIMKGAANHAAPSYV